MSVPHITVWAEGDSPRLRYVLDWLLRERLGLEYHLTKDKGEAQAALQSLSYGWLEGVPSIHAETLLWESDIIGHEIRTGEWQGLYALYLDKGSPCHIGFDLLAGIFYLLTRYEEYLASIDKRDGHGRYVAEKSVLFPVLERPVVDEWIEALRGFLSLAWDIAIPQKPFSYTASYDIDIAWSYSNKGLKRNIGGLLKDAANMDWKSVSERLQVLGGTRKDPYDSFDWIEEQHRKYALRPVFFILSALKSSRFDKNIRPTHSGMKVLIKALASTGQLGLHPSYYSGMGNARRLSKEKKVLEGIKGELITISRQHYIRLMFPSTYDLLLHNRLTDDYSMGYSTHFGFRAGTGNSYPWYRLPVDPELSANPEGQTALRVHPFAFMDTTGHYDLDLSSEEAFERLRKMAARLRACGGSLVTIMHNFSLGADKEWEGWRTAYELFLQEIALPA